MKMFAYITALLVVICLAVGCAASGDSKTHNFDRVDYQPRYAVGFYIAEDETGNRQLCVTRPWQGDALVEQRLAIFQSREEAEGYAGEYIIGGAKRVVCMSTSYIAMLDMVGKAENIVGVSGKQYVMTEGVASNQNVKDVGYDSNLDYEVLISLNPDLVLMYGVTAENGAVTAKLRELGIPYIYLGDYTEQSPLGKAEWLVAVADIMGVRAYGEELFAEIEQRYNAVREGISSENRPKVMFNTPYQDVWYMPSDDSYMVRLVEDAGGEYIYKGKNPVGGSRGVSLEEALRLVSESDVWLNVGQCNSLEELSVAAPHFMECEVVKRGEVYNNNNRRSPMGGSDFWESAIVRPDVVLEDLAKIMQGEAEGLYYHHRLKSLSDAR